MAKATLVTAALIVLMRASLLPAASNEVEQIYESLYGDEAKRALFTKGTVDDIALAKKLLEAAREVRKQPSLMVLLCQKAYEFGIKARPGYQTAIDAMDLVIKTVPADKLASQEKVARVFQKHFEGCKAKERARAGEELIRRLLVVADAKAATWDYEGESLYCRRALAVAKAVRSATRVPLEGRLRAVGERRRILKRVRALEAKVKADPKNVETRTKLILAHVVDMDDPEKASGFVNDEIDGGLRRCVSLAVIGGADDLSDEVCIELAEWYEDLSGTAGASRAKASMLRRAKAYYQRFLANVEGASLRKAKVTLALKKIDDALEKLALSGKEATKWQGPWWIIGPFPIAKFDDALPPEKSIKMEKHKGIGGREISWHAMKPPPHKGHGGIMCSFPNTRNAAWFVFRILMSPGPRKVEFRFGSDDGIKAWVNGKLLLSHNAKRSVAWDQERVGAVLKRGPNTVLIRINNGGGDCGLSFRILDERLKPVFVDERGFLRFR